MVCDSEINNCNQLKGFLALTATAAILGTFGILIRDLSTSFSDAGQVFIRSLFAAVIIAIIVIVKKINPFSFSRADLRSILIFSLVFPASQSPTQVPGDVDFPLTK
ncbi:MAG: hypothetical protein ACOCXQ_03545 [Patescibacteria group bacterium]